MSKLKHALQRSMIGGALVERIDLVKGACTFYTRPDRRLPLETAFNDQQGRRAIFGALVDAFDFGAIVETGTHQGLTTLYMHTTSGLDVHTIEANPKFYAFSRERFRKVPGIHGHFGDSRAFLKGLLPRLRAQAKPLLVYLDAHWEEDLPLREEVDVLFSQGPPCVILIDDFRVPDDPGYGYDDYGPGKVLEPEYFAPLAHHGFHAFVPALPASEESGAKRGCVVLAKDAALVEAIQGIQLLRELNGRTVPATIEETGET